MQFAHFSDMEQLELNRISTIKRGKMGLDSIKAERILAHISLRSVHRIRSYYVQYTPNSKGYL